MKTSEKIEQRIDNVKEWNQSAGNELHDQMNHAQSSEWSRSELSDYIKSDNDVADEHYEPGDPRHAEIREIQDSIINFYGE